jgi:hypothetical protein
MLLRNNTYCHAIHEQSRLSNKAISIAEISSTDFVVLYRNTTNKEKGVSETKLPFQCGIWFTLKTFHKKHT